MTVKVFCVCGFTGSMLANTVSVLHFLFQEMVWTPPLATTGRRCARPRARTISDKRSTTWHREL
jgi:hypothetical protein